MPGARTYARCLCIAYSRVCVQLSDTGARALFVWSSVHPSVLVGRLRARGGGGQVGSVDAVRSGDGNTYHFDGTYLYIRLVSMARVGGHRFLGDATDQWSEAPAQCV